MKREDQAFGARLRRHRVAAGLSQEALAERAGISVRGLSDLERGVRHMPHPATLVRLANALGLDPRAREALTDVYLQSAVEISPTTVEASPEPERVLETEGEAAQAPPSGLVQERRWVTVLVAEIVGFAALADKLDPEDLHLLASRCGDQLAHEIRQLGGTITMFDSDVLHAVFGAPVAHEDDAERAIRAALAVRECQLAGPADALSTGLDVRVGIDTGEVIAGPAGLAERREYGIVGSAASGALALMRAAPTHAVLVGAETYRVTRQRVRYRQMQPIGVSQTERALDAWEALAVGRLPRSRKLGTTPLVGRAAELQLLLTIWSRVAREGRPQVVSLVGEAGIGKSRLASEFVRQARAAGRVLVLSGRCLPYGQVAGYGALAEALRQAARITPRDTVEQARTRLGQLTATVCRPEFEAHDTQLIERHLALVTGLDTMADRTGAQADERIIQVSVRRFLEALARQQPVCLIVEDLHWADEALLNVLEAVAARAQGAPLLIVSQARPELLERRPTWGGGVRAFTSISLEPLDDAAGQSLARALCRDRGLADAEADRVGRVAGGNPLFAEELSAVLAEGRAPEGVPSALRALISARLDGLPPAEHQLILWAAVFGARVWRRGLAELGFGVDLAERLDALEQRDLIRAESGSVLAGDREYVFKHDLIREGAYSLLTRSERRRIHLKVVDWLDRAAGERVDELLELLAHHAIQAEQWARALDYLDRAAERARHAAAHREEAELLDRAIGCAERSGRADVVPDLHARRGRAFASVALWSAARRELEAALDLLPVERESRRAEVLLDHALASNWSMDTTALRASASQARALADRVGRVDLQVNADVWLAWATGSDGNVLPALDQYRTAFQRVDRLGVHLSPSVLPLYAHALCWAGEFSSAVERSRQAVDVARRAGDTDATILALQVLGLALAGRGAYDAAAQMFDESVRFGREHGIGPFLARALAMSAGFHLDVFDYQGHEAVVDEARELARSVGFSAPLVSAGVDLLLGLARRGEVARAEHLTVEVSGTVKQVAWHAWLYRLRFTQARAEIALARGDLDEVARLSQEALEQSRGRRPKYEMLARLTRAEGLARSGRRQAALDDLHAAVDVARAIGDPALVLRSSLALLRLDGNDALLAETHTVAASIASRLPTDQMRERFRSAEEMQPLHLA